jgi:hypothetical protein
MNNVGDMSLTKSKPRNEVFLSGIVRKKDVYGRCSFHFSTRHNPSLRIGAWSRSGWLLGATIAFVFCDHAGDSRAMRRAVCRATKDDAFVIGWNLIF